MITFKSFLKEEVFNWYIVKGTSSKGKVSHVGTERQLKLKIRKPTFPKGHILLKSRKRLTIGDVWKGSMGVSEEVKIDEVLKPGTKVKVPHPAKGKGMVTGKIVRYDKGGPHSPFYIVDIGEPRSEKIPANKIKEEVEIDEGALYDKKDGIQKKWMDELEKGIKTAVVQIGKSAIGGDSIMIRISLDPEKDWNNKIYQNSRFSQFHLDRDGSLEQFAKRHNLSKFRKTKVKTAKAAVDKINTWIKKEEPTPYKP